MRDPYEIRNTELSDLPIIFELFKHSIRYQEKHGYPVWRNYDRAAIIQDVENRNQYKVIVDGKIGIVYSVCYADPIIWRDRDQGDSVYLHRIVVNPECKGHKLFGVILDWATQFAKQKGWSSVRMDTWASNPTIIDYYKSFGFSIVEDYTTPDTLELPIHNRNLSLTLLEYKLNAE